MLVIMLYGITHDDVKKMKNNIYVLQMKQFNVKKFMTLPKKGRDIVYGIVLILLIWCVIRSLKENYEGEQDTDSVGPSAEQVEMEKDEEIKKIVEEKNISQEDLNLIFKML